MTAQEIKDSLMRIKIPESRAKDSSTEKSIKDIPSIRELKTKIRELKLLASSWQEIPAIRELDFIEDFAENIRPEINDLENRLGEMFNALDFYNQYFCPKGWIAHESLNSEIMQLAVQFAKQEKMKEAEKILLSYYNHKNLDPMLMEFQNTEPFSKRFNIIEKANEDYESKRFSSCVLHLLITIDGSVNDIEDTGFFANKINLSAWDSIAGHSSGLGKLKELFNKNRKGTNTKEIFIPYRNGILHGRDINFNNKYVAAKCWSALIAIYDWAMALKDKGRTDPEKAPVPGLIEITRDFIQALRDKAIVLPRKLEIGKDVPEWGIPEQYELGSPERKAVEFMSYWQKKQWDRTTPMLQRNLSKIDIISEEEIGYFKIIQNEDPPQPIRILKIDDQNFNTTEVHILVNFAVGILQGERIIPLRFVYEAHDGTSIIRGNKAGDWFLVGKSIIPIDYNKK